MIWKPRDSVLDMFLHEAVPVSSIVELRFPQACIPSGLQSGLSELIRQAAVFKLNNIDRF